MPVKNNFARVILCSVISFAPLSCNVENAVAGGGTAYFNVEGRAIDGASGGALEGALVSLSRTPEDGIVREFNCITGGGGVFSLNAEYGDGYVLGASKEGWDFRASLSENAVGGISGNVVYIDGSFKLDKDIKGKVLVFYPAGGSYSGISYEDDVEEESVYAITVEVSEGGRIIVNRTSAYAGDVVVFSLAADAGYEAGDVYMSGAEGMEIIKKSGVYEFEMPACDITLRAEFKPFAAVNK